MKTVFKYLVIITLIASLTPICKANDVRSASSYAFCLNNPVRYTDPTGKFPIETIWDIGNVLYDIGAAVVNHIKGDHSAAMSNWTDLGMDAAAMFIPYVPAGATKVLKAADVAADVAKTADKAADVKKAATITENAAQGKSFEKAVSSKLEQAGHTNVAEQVTVKAENGVKTRVDFVSKDATGKVSLTEAKSSATAPLTPNQKSAFPSIETGGGVVVGKGKAGFEGGTIIQPTEVKIFRPEDLLLKNK